MVDPEVIFGYVASAIGGGGVVKLFTLRSTTKKAAVDVKKDEIQLIHDTIEQVYQPIINQQNKTIEQQNKTIEQQNTRIQGLDSEVRELREQLTKERKAYQEDIDILNKRIIAITQALGLKANDSIRTSKGKRKKSTDDKTSESEQ